MFNGFVRVLGSSAVTSYHFAGIHPAEPFDHVHLLARTSSVSESAGRGVPALGGFINRTGLTWKLPRGESLRRSNAAKGEG